MQASEASERMSSVSDLGPDPPAIPVALLQLALPSPSTEILIRQEGGGASLPLIPPLTHVSDSDREVRDRGTD